MLPDVKHETVIDRFGSEPLFTQVEHALYSAIDEGVLEPGERLPSELELSEYFGVSRITIRRAVSELCERGALIKRQGKGTFVRERKMSRKIEHVASFTESCLASGMRPSAVVKRREMLKSPPVDLITRSEIVNESVLYIQRMHFADGIPIMIENNYYPYSRFHFLMSEPLETSLFASLKERDVIVSGSENSYIDAVAASRDQAAQLSVLTGDPLFVLYLETLDQNGDLIYVGRQHIVANRYRFAYGRE